MISQSDLPIYVLKYQIKDLHSEIERLANDLSQKEINEYYQSQQMEEESSDK